MIAAARASRKLRSTLSPRPKQAPHGQVGDAKSGLPRGRFAVQQRQQRSRSGIFHLIGDVFQERLLRVHGDLHLRQPGAQVRQRGQRLAQVLQL